MRPITAASIVTLVLLAPLALTAIAHSPTPQPREPPGPTRPLADRVAALAAAAGAEIGVVVETLDGTQRHAVNESTQFHAASTMKVPVMIELFRQAAAGTLSLDDRVPVVNEFRSLVDGSTYSLEVGDDSDADIYEAIGTPMAYRTLCEAMITVSSNLATNVLIQRLGIENIRKTFAEHGGEGMNVRRGVEDGKAFRAGLSNTTNARGYAALLLAIARGTAVSPAASAEMQDVLKRQKFNDAIPAGLPPGTLVGHKTGSITRIHHDGAIVYGARPYVLVVLTRGIEDQKASAALIADVTREIHAYLDKGPVR
jgi:beta-lactamase class A